jgi:glycogen synthase
MRVLITGDTVGGVFTYVCELTRALSARGVDVCLALTGRRLAPDQRRALRDSGASRIFADELALEWMQDPWPDVERAGAWLQEIAAELDPDVVHLNDYAHGALAWEAPVLVVGHSCVLSWYRAVRGQDAPHAWDEYGLRVRSGLAGADLVAAPTRVMLAELERHYGPLARTAVIPNGLPSSGIVRPKERFVLAAGRLWDEAKNLAALDRAAGLVEWPVLVCGDAPAERPRHAQLLGRLSRDELAERYAQAAIFAAPARYEPFGLAVLEAALAGCTLVLGDIPSFREVWGDAALYVEPDDERALAAAIHCAIEAPLSATGRAALYTPELMADRYLEIYEQLTVAEPEPAEAVA